MVSMSTMLADAIAELADLPMLVNAQVDAGMAKNDVVDALFDSWSIRIGTLAGLRAGQKKELTDAVVRGPWDPVQKSTLAKSIISGEPLTGSPSMARKSNQVCSNFENFIPEGVWATLRRQTNLSSSGRASMLAGVAHSIHLFQPTEPTLFRMAAIMAWSTDYIDITQEEVYQYMDKLRAFVKIRQAQATKKKLANLLTTYPTTADELPRELKELAYTDAEGHVIVPPAVSIPELDTIFGGLKMRGKKDMGWMKHVPPHLRDYVSRSFQGQCQHRLMQGEAASSSRDVPMLGGQSSMYSPGSRSTRAIGHAEHQLALMPIQPERAGLRAPIALVDNATADDGADDGIDEMEGALLAAHASRLKPKKRLIAEVDEDDVDEEDGDGEDEAPSAGPKKRPASAAGALKRPAGAVKRPAAAVAAFKIGKGIKLGAGKIDMSDIFKKMVDDYKTVGLTRNAFTSRAYSHGRKRMLLSGASDKAAIEFARTMLTKASELWESL
jgi:hypothetical protein